MKALTAISLFTGAGGLDYGFEAAGFLTCVAVEFDPSCRATIGKNRDWPIIDRDIHSVSGREILKTAGLSQGEPDVLIGGPPCQPFSKSAYWASNGDRGLSDPRARTIHEYMRCVEETLPKAFMLENVPGLNRGQSSEAVEVLLRLTERVNKRTGTRYELSWAVLNAADYGVPQLRKRFFVVGDRRGRAFRFPDPTHAPPQCSQTPTGANPHPYTTAWDAIGGVRPDPSEELCVTGAWADLLPSIPEGQNYLWHTRRKRGKRLFGWRRRYWSFLLKLAKDRPSPTIQSQPGSATGPFHWESRRLSIEEMARLQTFPEGTVFVGGRTSVHRQIGNAVPSLLAEVLAREIRSQLLELPIGGRLKLAVQPRRPIPPPERCRPVPRRYLHLVGEHADHPGEGRGPGARYQGDLPRSPGAAR